MDAEATGAEGGRCAVHPERAGTACARCGTFGCQDCLVTNEGAPLCRECLARARVALPSLAGRARWARAAILASAVAELVLLPFTHGPDDAGGLLVALTMLLGGLVQLAAPFVFLAWFHLAARHALALGVYLEVSAWRAVGSWFIPFVNLVQPFDLVRRMCPTTQVGLWQALFILGNVANRVTRSRSAAQALIPALVVVGAALAGGKVVQDVTARLAAPGGAPGPSSA